MPKQNQTTRTKKKIAPSDIVLMLMAIFLLFKTPWSHMESFDYLLIFLYIFCMMMRLSNMRKRFAKEQAIAQAKAEQEAAEQLELSDTKDMPPVETCPTADSSPEQLPLEKNDL